MVVDGGAGTLDAGGPVVVVEGNGDGDGDGEVVVVGAVPFGVPAVAGAICTVASTALTFSTSVARWAYDPITA